MLKIIFYGFHVLFVLFNKKANFNFTSSYDQYESDQIFKNIDFSVF